MTREDVGAADLPAQTAGRPADLHGVCEKNQDEPIIRGRVVRSTQHASVPMPAEADVIPISDETMTHFVPFAREIMRACCTHDPFFTRQAYFIPGRQHRIPAISDHPTAAMEDLSMVSPQCELVA